MSLSTCFLKHHCDIADATAFLLLHLGETCKHQHFSFFFTSFWLHLTPSSKSRPSVCQSQDMASCNRCAWLSEVAMPDWHTGEWGWIELHFFSGRFYRIHISQDPHIIYDKRAWLIYIYIYITCIITCIISCIISCIITCIITCIHENVSLISFNRSLSIWFPTTKACAANTPRREVLALVGLAPSCRRACGGKKRYSKWIDFASFNFLMLLPLPNSAKCWAPVVAPRLHTMQEKVDLDSLE